MEELCKITFEDAAHKTIIIIRGENDTMKEASMEFIPSLMKEEITPLSAILAKKFMKHLIGQ